MPMTIEELHKVADQHITRFTNMIRQAKQGTAGIRLGECEAYLEIWERVRTRTDLNALQKDERGELLDYCYSENLGNPYGQVYPQTAQEPDQEPSDEPAAES